MAHACPFILRAARRAALVFVEKAPRVGAALVAPIAALLVGLGLWIVLDASSVPGLTPPM